MKLFGTDGIRALINTETMGPEMGVKMGVALVLYCQKKEAPLKIIIGRDTRESGPMLEDAIISGIISMGGTAVSAGVIPTPGLAYLIGAEKAGAGIMISASHNSFEYNGLKPFNSDGTKLTNEEEEELQKYILEGGAKKIGADFVLGQKIILAEAKEKYADFLLSKFSALEAGDLKIVLDCANGATAEVAPKVFAQKVSVAATLFFSPDGKNINANCGSQHVETLQKKVLEMKADVGLAFDGDGDRLIAVSQNGQVLSGDQIIYLIAKMMHEKNELKNNAVVTTVMSNLGFVSSLRKLGISHFATGVGDRSVFFEMQKQAIVLGGEESGHIILSNFQPTGDGIAAGLQLISALKYFGKSLSELISEVTLFPKLLINVMVQKKPELETVPEIMQAIKSVEDKLGTEGRVLVRYSGTENLCRVMVEGRNEKEITVYADEIAKVVAEKLN